MIGALLSSIFRPSPADRAFKKCMAPGRELDTTAMIFHGTLKMVGSDLRPDESALDELGRILLGSDEPEQTLNGVSVFLGCIITEPLVDIWDPTVISHLRGGISPTPSAARELPADQPNRHRFSRAQS